MLSDFFPKRQGKAPQRCRFIFLSRHIRVVSSDLNLLFLNLVIVRFAIWKHPSARRSSFTGINIQLLSISQTESSIECWCE